MEQITKIFADEQKKGRFIMAIRGLGNFGVNKVQTQLGKVNLGEVKLPVATGSAPKLGDVKIEQPKIQLLADRNVVENPGSVQNPGDYYVTGRDSRGNYYLTFKDRDGNLHENIKCSTEGMIESYLKAYVD